MAWSLVAAVVGLGLLVVGLLVDARRAWFSYLDVWTFATTTCVGALILLMVDHAAKASWMVVTRRLNEAVVDAMPLLLLLAVPIAFGLGELYPWAKHPDALDPALRHAVLHKRIYLNRTFFLFRSAVYFIVFIGIARLLRVWSLANDQTPRAAFIARMRRLSGGGLPIVALTFTWASFDWTMSLEPDWFSTIYGLYYFAGGFVGAIALICVLLPMSRARREVADRVTPDHAQAIGRVLFAMIIFWAYMAFSQLLIYWIADIPEEVRYYGPRTTGSWTAITALLICGHFAAPFLLLLNRRLKRHPAYLRSVGQWMLAMHFVDVYWLVMPSYDGSGVRPHWLDLAAILFVGGLSSAWIAHRYFAVAPIPRHVPDLAEGLNYEAAL